MCRPAAEKCSTGPLPRGLDLETICRRAPERPEPVPRSTRSRCGRRRNAGTSAATGWRRCSSALRFAFERRPRNSSTVGPLSRAILRRRSGEILRFAVRRYRSCRVRRHACTATRPALTDVLARRLQRAVGQNHTRCVHDSDSSGGILGIGRGHDGPAAFSSSVQQAFPVTRNGNVVVPKPNSTV
jgi:hypothetical protein